MEDYRERVVDEGAMSVGKRARVKAGICSRWRIFGRSMNQAQ